MMLAKAFLTVNWPGILAAAVVAFAWGALYYGILCNVWVAAQGRTTKDFKAADAGKSTAAKAAPFILCFAALIVMSWVLYGLFLHMGVFSIRGGIISGTLCWFGFVLTTVAVNNAFAGRPAKLTLIDAGHWLGTLVILGALVGWSGP